MEGVEYEERPDNRWGVAAKILMHWLISRAIFYLGGIFAICIAKPVSNDTVYFPSWKRLFDSFASLSIYADGTWYERIAHYGYASHPFVLGVQENWAFFPMFPLLIKVVGIKLCFLLSLLLIVPCGFILLHDLMRSRFGDEVSYNAVILALYFPFSYALSAFRPEGMMLTAWVMVLWFRNKEMTSASVIAGVVAALCKPNGFLISVPVFWEIVVQFRKNRQIPSLKDLAILIAPPFAVVMFSIFIWSKSGDPLAWSKVQASWGAQFFVQPVAQIYQFFTNPTLIGRWGWDPTLLNWFVFFGVIVAVVKLVPKHNDLAAFLVAVLLLSFLNFGVWVQGRQMTSVFPLFLGLSLTLPNREVMRTLLQVFSALLAASGIFVALGVHAFLA